MDALFWAILLLAIGIALVLLEMCVPSGGLLGLLAACAVVAAIVVGFNGGAKTGVGVLIAAMIVVPSVVVLAVRVWPQTRLGRMILIERPEDQDEVLPDTEPYRELTKLIGRTGTAKTDMLPSGMVTIDGRGYDAISDGKPIDQGQHVEVVAVRTNRLIVRFSTKAVDNPAPTEENDILARPAEELGIDAMDDPLA